MEKSAKRWFTVAGSRMVGLSCSGWRGPVGRCNRHRLGATGARRAPQRHRAMARYLAFLLPCTPWTLPTPGTRNLSHENGGS